MIVKFKLFEVQMKDNVKLFKNKLPNDKYLQIKNEIDKTFNVDEELVEKIYIDGETLSFAWNHRPDHDIYLRIKERTHLKSISEFNDIFIKTINQIIPSKLGKSGIDKDGCYALYLKDNQFYIMIQIDPESLINGIYVDYYGNNKPYHSWIITIHNNSTLDKYKYYKKIDIDDSNFHL